MSFYTKATELAIKNPKTIVDIELMYERCLTYAPGTNEHRVLLYEDGSTFYHRIFIGSSELADVRKGKAVIIAKTREFNKEDVINIESFIKVNTKSAILQLKELAGIM